MRTDRDHKSPAGKPCATVDPLHRTLSKLAHLDLTGRVQYDSATMKANGGYCDVFVGTVTTSSGGKPSKKRAANPTMKVAVKRLRIHIRKDQNFQKFLAKELSIWSKLEHVNILPLQGFVLEGDYPLVIAEWMEHGTVREYLKEETSCDIKAMVTGIANGIDYLHNQNVVHSDLKADNVLVSRSGEPLICDFGISRMLSSSSTIGGTSTGSIRGSMRWLAYELLDLSSDGNHTKESDVWAFGMTVFEILTKELPYSRYKIDPLVLFAIKSGELPSCPADFRNWPLSHRSLWDVCEECWVLPPERRITAKQIVAKLKVSKPRVARSNQGTNDRRRRNSLHAPDVGTSSCSTSRNAERKHHSEGYQTEQEHNEDSTKKTRPPQMNVTPLLKDTQRTRLDLACHSFAPQTPNNDNVGSQKYIPVGEGHLSQIATHPDTTNMRITCREFGQFGDAWAISVKLNHPITVGDVLRAVHRHVQIRMTDEEWAKLAENDIYEAGRAYTRRCREAEFEKVQGVRRVDLFGRKRWFGGLKKGKDGDLHNFELLLKTELKD